MIGEYTKTTVILTFPTLEKQTVLGGGYIDSRTATTDTYKVPASFTGLFLSNLRVMWRQKMLTCTQVQVLSASGSNYTLEITTNNNVVRFDHIEAVEAVRGVVA